MPKETNAFLICAEIRHSKPRFALFGGRDFVPEPLGTCMRCRARDPEGRVVVFDAWSHLHLTRRRPWLLDHLDAIMATISEPDWREPDPRPDRERFYRQHLDLKRWMRVVVDFGGDPAWVVTVAIQRYDPRGKP